MDFYDTADNSCFRAATVGILQESKSADHGGHVHGKRNSGGCRTFQRQNAGNEVG